MAASQIGGSAARNVLLKQLPKLQVRMNPVFVEIITQSSSFTMERFTPIGCQSSIRMGLPSCGHWWMKTAYMQTVLSIMIMKTMKILSRGAELYTEFMYLQYFYHLKYICVPYLYGCALRLTHWKSGSSTTPMRTGRTKCGPSIGRITSFAK